MEFNSSYDQTNFMGYYPPSPISNDGCEYHQENTNSEHSNPWRFASETQDEQENHMGYFPPPQNDASCYSNSGWEYHQEMIDDEAIHMRYDPGPQNDLYHYPHGLCVYQQECEQSRKMNFLPEPQSEPCCYDTDTNYGWEGNFNSPNAIHQETSSLNYAFNKFMQDSSQGAQDCPYYDNFNNSSSCAWEEQNQKAFESPYSTYQEPSSLERAFNSLLQNCPTSPPSSSFENSSSIDYPMTQNLFQNSQSTQTSMNQSLSRLETMLESYEREAQRSWKERKNSLTNMEVMLAQLVSATKKEEGKDEEASVSSELSMNNEVVENETTPEVTKEHEHS
ncbi:hypothetical protein AHAS_Ahas06G0143600 [Arachis hypogaea]